MAGRIVKLKRSTSRKRTKKAKRYNLEARVRNALRRLWFWGPQRKEAVKSAKISPGLFLCAICKKPQHKICVDHKIPIGLAVDWDEYIKFLFCDSEALQVLCIFCHKEKTVKDMELIRAKRKQDKATKDS